MILSENAKAQALEIDEYCFDDIEEDDDEYEADYSIAHVLNGILAFNDIEDIKAKKGESGDVVIFDAPCKEGERCDKSKGIFWEDSCDLVFAVENDTVTGIANLYEVEYGLVYSPKMNLVLGMGHSNSVLWDATTMKELLRTDS